MTLSLFVIKIYKKLTAEMFKVSRGLSPEIVKVWFQFREQVSYELRKRPQFQILWAHSIFSGTGSLKSFKPEVWVPNEMKQLESLGKLRSAIR